MTTPTATLEQYRALAADARAALRMIREAVEQHAPPGSVPRQRAALLAQDRSSRLFGDVHGLPPKQK